MIGVGLVYILVLLWREPFSRGLIGFLLVVFGIVVEIILTAMVFSPKSRPDWLTPVAGLAITIACVLSTLIGYLILRSVDDEEGDIY
jgi:hypothetical protein